ncbi:type II toxin-antitoxin system death-on-curing family toxin [Methylobacterium nodulans]|uniref:Death-on-curing family protein n=1 Tax=Methylobacterium nodulans (strain LMG 21967 / CNCM I-2342 / ORS 2060) TaxID=460265 RepID=B8IVP2_METNO|nr:type II toxin-antitoxin system death-on-curing family toxin [Methylobacterium nodulans]ACL62482.1 death-on-curing family protein [Methylobacterium nodulans ORS 2060]
MPIWIIKEVVLAVHDEQLAEHGGSSGVRDEGALDSALARPQNKEAYGCTDIMELAAAYAFGVARNHPFIDGNKRTSFVVTLLFLHMNGFVLTAPQSDRVTTWLSIAAGEMDEAAIAAWLRANTRPI